MVFHAPFVRFDRRPALSAVLAGLALAWTGGANAAGEAPQEIHQRLDPPQAVALTLDACAGGFDRRLIGLLVAHQVPATLFLTRRWIQRNPEAARELVAHADLFELEDHGAAHRPALVGSERRLYGMPGVPDESALRAEVQGGADAVEQLSGRRPRLFRGAGAAYDAGSRRIIAAMGLQIAGFSVNADGGATLPAATVAARLQAVRPGDVVIAHMNRPGSGTAEGFARAIPALRERGVAFVKLSQATLVTP